MRSVALACSVLLLALTPCIRAFAHGLAPDAYAIVSQDAQGLRAVSLSAGLALRRSAQRYQFVCPAAWGDQFPAPVAALPDGTIVVGAARGLMLLGEDGIPHAHPDPAAVGRSQDMVRTAHGVFSLRPGAQGSEVLAIDAQTVRVLWKDAKNVFSSLAVLDDKLVLLRETNRLLEQVTIAAPDGAELERRTAQLDLPVDYVFARANAGAAYALLVFPNATVALGSLATNTFTKLVEGQVLIAGPLSIGSGTLIGLDGQLSELVDGRPTPLADAHFVVCLAQYDGVTYACDNEGITRVGDHALTEPLFRFSWLTAPNLELVPVGDARMHCVAQWQDLRSDLELTGTSLLEEIMPTAGGAPSATPVAGGGVAMPLPGAPPSAGNAAIPSAGGGAMVAPKQPTPEGGAGCTVSLRTNAPHAAYAWGFVLVLGLARRLRFRSRRTPR